MVSNIISYPKLPKINKLILSISAFWNEEIDPNEITLNILILTEYIFFTNIIDSN